MNKSNTLSDIIERDLEESPQKSQQSQNCPVNRSGLNQIRLSEELKKATGDTELS